MSSGRGLAVVVPTLDEAEHLPALLEDLRVLGATVVVADGGSSDGTRALAHAAGAHVVSAARGRGSQLRAGAAATTEPWLLFLHADSRLPPASARALSAFLASAEEDEYAHFRFALAGDGMAYRLIERGQRIRERVTGLAYGDQGLVVARTLYERASGHPVWPILEDVGVLERLARHGRRRPLDAELSTSPRRYEHEGRVRGWLRNVAIIAGYRLGVPPERLARWFPRGRAPETGRRPLRTVAVFLKAPRPGHVKTRLAVDLGAAEATRVYRSLAEATVRSLTGGEHRVVVYYDPPDAEARGEVAAWLDAPEIELRPQRGSDLGRRMAAALAECLADADQACIVGTDVPGLGAARVDEAFELLAARDVVIGPATDGGYYLIALREPRSALFEDIRWSTDSVLAATLERARSIGASVELLEPMTDVDTASDVPPGLRSA